MTNVNTIESNPVDISGVKTATATTAATGSDPLGFASYLSSLTGPVATAATAGYGSTESAEIVAAATTAASGASYGTSGLYSGASGVYGSSLSGLSTSYGGSLSATTTGSYTSDDMLSMAQEQLASSQASSIAMLMVQDDMSQQNRLYTTASNMMSTRDSMLATIIRNVKSA
ncbi:MAG: hypothetical protein HYU99_01800 [Deltaproteobacteria bacterium]|nr:hypothetical protein [Deltaproteobacteria bacterium]